MLSAMNTLATDWPDDVEAALNALPAGHAFTVPDVLFAKITDDQREDWQTRFAGTRG
jgi:methionyl-tRNA synthetase